MSKSHARHRNTFEGGIDMDTTPELMAPGDYIDAENVMSGYGQVEGGLSVQKGTTSQTIETLLTGTSRVIGAKEDRQTGAIYIFLYNSNGQHRIVKWDAQTETMVRVGRLGDGFNFHEDWKISHAEMVDGKMLCWTDGRSFDSASIEGNPPRKLNMEKAITKGKVFEGEIYAGVDGEGQFATGRTYTLKRWQSESVLNTYVFTSPGGFADKKAGMDWLSGQIDALSTVAAYDCDGCKIKLTSAAADDFFTLETSNGDAILVFTNRYPVTIQGYHIDLVKRPPRCAPVPVYKAVPSVSTNNVLDGAFQFRTRYIYDDGEKSAWSDISATALNIDAVGNIQRGMNCIEVRFTDAVLTDPSWLNIVREVEVSVRKWNNGDFRSIGRFPVCELGLLKQSVDFFGDKLLEVCASDDLSVPVSGQLLKDFDNVPLLSGVLSTISDEHGDSRLALGANLEGYDCPDCVDIRFTSSDYSNACLVDVSGTVVIDRTFASLADDHKPDYDSYPLGGFVVYLAGTSHYAISNNPADGSGDGSFTIKGVPKGKYILRVASYLCRYDDEWGPRYNLNNGLEWQRTSSPVNSMDHGIETLLDLTAASGTVSFGNIHIANAHYSQLESNAFLFMEAYVLDNDGKSTTVAEKVGAIGVEKIPVYWAAALAVHETVADANGYTFNHSTLAAYLGPSVGASGYTSLSKLTDKGWKSVYDDTYLTTVGPPYLCRFFAWNTAPAWSSAHKRTVHGKVVDANGLPLSNVLVQLANNGRQETTGANGEYSFAVFEDVAAATFPALHGWSGNRVDTMWATYRSDLCYDYPPTPTSSPLTIGFPNPTGFFEIANIAFPVPGGIVSQDRFLKAGGVYRFGIQYEDYAGRHNGVCEGAEVRVPFHTQNAAFGKKTWSWEIWSTAPSWADRYRIVRQKDSFYSWYLQWVTDEVRYGRVTAVNEDPVFTTFLNGDATHIFLKVNAPVDMDSATDPVLFFFREFKQNGYEPASGDRVRFVLDEKGALVATNRIVEAPISGRYIDGDGNYFVVVDYFELGRAINSGWLVEFLSPRIAVDNVYYGDGGCYNVLAGGLHAGPLQNQTSSLPARGRVVSGDTYWRYQGYLFGSGNGKPVFSEHQTVSDLHQYASADLGRASVEQPDQGRRFLWHQIRYSDLYRSSTKVNGMSSFGLLAFQSLDRSFGAIKWLGRVGDVLLAICRRKAQSLYMGKGRVIDLRGNTSVGRSDEILHIANAFVSDAGTDNPESVVAEHGIAMWWDKWNGKVWQYSQAGIAPVTKGLVSFFRERGKERVKITGADFTPAGFDRTSNRYVLTLGANSYPTVEGSTAIAAQTIAYSVVENRWKSRYTHHADWYGRAAQFFLGYIGAIQYQHHRSGIYNNVYGSQLTALVKFSVNPAPVAVKDFMAMSLMSKRKWHSPLIETPPGDRFPLGQKSRLKAGRWEGSEGRFVADILRDHTDMSAPFASIADQATREAAALLNGQVLKGSCLVVTLSPESPSVDQSLIAVDTTFTPSEETSA